MVTAFRVALHRSSVRAHLRDAAYLATDRQLREDLGDRIGRLSHRAVRESWAPRTTAAILAAIWVAGHGRRLEAERRLRVAEVIMDQERRHQDPLRWLEDFHLGSMNVVGVDIQLMRFNLANGTIVAWIAEGKGVDPRVRRVLLAMTAWGLSDMPAAEMEERLQGLIDDLRE